MTETTTLPELRLADWRATRDTLHLYAQIEGKIRLATTAPRNHWWNVPLYVDVRGLTTRRLHHRHTTFEITMDGAGVRRCIEQCDRTSRVQIMTVAAAQQSNLQPLPAPATVADVIRRR